MPNQQVVTTTTTTSQKSVLGAYALWFFFGQLGVHRFYLGKTGTGVFQLLLGIFGWALLTFVVGIFLLIPHAPDGAQYYHENFLHSFTKRCP